MQDKITHERHQELRGFAIERLRLEVEAITRMSNEVTPIVLPDAEAELFKIPPHKVVILMHQFTIKMLELQIEFIGNDTGARIAPATLEKIRSLPLNSNYPSATEEVNGVARLWTASPTIIAQSLELVHQVMSFASANRAAQRELTPNEWRKIIEMRTVEDAETFEEEQMDSFIATLTQLEISDAAEASRIAAFLGTIGNKVYELATKYTQEVYHDVWMNHMSTFSNFFAMMSMFIDVYPGVENN